MVIMGNYGKQMFNKLDKVAIVAIGRYLTLRNDYLSLLVTCKRLYHFLKNVKFTTQITLQYCIWNEKGYAQTLFIDSHRKQVKKESSMLVRWRGKYTQGWYDRSGTSRRIEIIYPSETHVSEGWIDLPYIYCGQDIDITQYIDFENNTVNGIYNGHVIDKEPIKFPDNLAVKEFLGEVEYIHRHKKEAELRWNYQTEKEIRL